MKMAGTHFLTQGAAFTIRAPYALRTQRIAPCTLLRVHVQEIARVVQPIRRGEGSGAMGGRRAEQGVSVA